MRTLNVSIEVEVTDDGDDRWLSLIVADALEMLCRNPSFRNGTYLSGERFSATSKADGKVSHVSMRSTFMNTYELGAELPATEVGLEDCPPEAGNSSEEPA
jgi:hypothetical protein